MSNNNVTKEAVKAALDNMGISVRLNRISGQPDISGFSSNDPARILPIKVRDQLDGISVSKRAIEAHLAAIAYENSYNPVQEMLDETMRDGQDRIAALLDQAMGLDGRQVEKDTVKRWLHQTMAMAFNGEKNTGSGTEDSGHDVDADDGGFDDGSFDDDGFDDDDDPYVTNKKPRLYGADGLLVLVGPQGCGKSLLVSKLGVSYDLFIGGRSINVSDKDNIIINTSRWITELCDIKKLTSPQKAFITASKDSYSFAYKDRYGICRIMKPRRTSFCATANKVPTELGRRLWVVDASNFDLAAIKALDKDWVKQLWKQVYEELYLPNPQGFRVGKGKATKATADTETA